MANKWTPLLNDYAKYSMQGAFQPIGSEGAYKFGDMETIGGTPEVTEIERWSREDAIPFLARTDVTRKALTLTLNVFSMSRFMKAALWMDDPELNLTQVAGSTLTKIYTQFKQGQVYGTGFRDITVTEFTDGEVDGVEYVEGEHYRLFEETGDFEWLAPSLTTGGEITFSAAAIAATAGRQEIGLMAGSGMRGKLTLWGTNEIGEPVHIELWDVKLTPSGEISLHGGDEYTSATLTARVYGDGSKPARFRYGRMVNLAAE